VTGGIRRRLKSECAQQSILLGTGALMPIAEDQSTHPVAVLLIDVINDFDFPEAEALIPVAEHVAPRIEVLAARARDEGVPVIYVNDNFGRWRSDFRNTVSRCCDAASPGNAIVRRLAPKENDFFVLKPMHSGFFNTPLELLLDELDSGMLILCGFATNSCVAFTAHDAHMRGFRSCVPRDTTAANTPALAEQALALLESTLRADTRESGAVSFDELVQRGSERRRRRQSS
jgi:nicotinamidase-related amidase